MIRRFCRWFLSDELLKQYLDGWEDGVNQQLFEPETCEHGYISPVQYWGPDWQVNLECE
jgi:hypothetical protein